MATALSSNTRERLLSAAAVAAVHALVAYLLLAGLGVTLPGSSPAPSLKLFDLPTARDPPLAADPAPDKTEGASAEAVADPREGLPAPPPAVPIPLPTQPAASASPTTPAMGSGSGESGSGYGAGGGGGTGGGVASRARKIAGTLTNADYPRAARRAGAEGTVFVRFTVGADGRARHCIVTRTSGNADLDATTCHLVHTRFRFEPARDKDGRPVADMMAGQQNWWISNRR